MKSQVHFPLVMLSVLLFCAAGLRAGPPRGSSAPERAAVDANSQPVSVGNERVAVLIGFRNVSGPSEQALVRSQGGVIKYSYHLVPGLAASLPQPAAAALAGNPAVTHVEPDGKVYATDAELDNAWGVKRIGAGVVHAPPNSNTGLGVKVAIIDTGIDYTHPSWTRTTREAGISSIRTTIQRMTMGTARTWPASSRPRIMARQRRESWV